MKSVVQSFCVFFDSQLLILNDKIGLLLEGDENLLEAKFVSTEKDGEVLASAELKANVEVEEFSYSYYDVWGIVGDMSIGECIM